MPEVTQLANGRVKITGVRKRFVKWGKHEGGHRTEQMVSDVMRSWVSYVRPQCHRDSERVTHPVGHRVLAGLVIHPRLASFGSLSA